MLRQRRPRAGAPLTLAARVAGLLVAVVVACAPAPMSAPPAVTPGVAEPAATPLASIAPSAPPAIGTVAYRSVPLLPIAAFTSLREDVRLAELRDVLVPRSLARAVRDRLPNVRVVELDDDAVLPALRAEPEAIALVTPDRVDPSVKTLALDGVRFWTPGRPAYPLSVTLPGPPTVAELAPTWDLLAAGGIIYGRGVQERVEKYGDPARPFAKVRELTRAADLAIATLEAPLSGDGNRFCADCMVFVGDERYVSGIVEAGFDALSLAANHIGDAGPRGVLDSIRTVAGAGIVAFGAGADEAAARRPALLERRGVRVALLGYSDVPPESYAATSARAGHARLSHDDPTYASVRADIAAARSQADVVIVVVHWGIEYEDRPRPWIVAAAQAMADAGATAVLGDHPHWVQSVEVYRGAYIAYSLGNFVFDQMWSIETRQGSLHHLFFSGSRLVSVRIVPTLLEDYHQPRPLRPDEPGYAQTLARIWRHSTFGPSGPGAVR